MIKRNLMLKNYFAIFITLACLMHLNSSNGQVYAPDTTFKLNFNLETGTKINFLHKTDENSYFIGTNISDDFGKPFIRNLYKVDTVGKLINTFKDINSTLVRANGDRILLTNIGGTFLFQNEKFVFITKKNVVDVNWKTNEILINENGLGKIIDFQEKEKYNLNQFSIISGRYGITRTMFFNKTIATYDSNKLTLHDYTGKQLTFPFENPLPYFGSYMTDQELFKINENLVGINSFDYSFPNYRNIVTILDSTGKIISNKSTNFNSKLICTEDGNLILRSQAYGSVLNYSFHQENWKLIKNKTLFGENYRKVIPFDDYFLTTDGLKIIKLSTKNSKYIEVILPDTLTVNDKPIKILTRTIGSKEVVNISCDCGLIKDDTLFSKKVGNYIINFKTNAGLVLHKNLTIKKRADSISFTGFRDLYLSELPLKFSIKSKSNLPVKYSLEYNRNLILKNDEVINQGLPSSYNNFQYQYKIYLKTLGNEEFESKEQILVFKLKGIYEGVSLENHSANFILYPNPIIDNSVKVLYTGSEAISNPNFTLYNITGKEFDILVRNDSNDYIYHVSFPKLQTGVYFLKAVFYSFKLDKEVQEIKRFIVK